MYVEKLASQIKNDILSGLRGYHQNLSLSIQQLEDEVIQTRMYMLKEYITKGEINLRDFLVAINCVNVDCESLERCKCSEELCSTLTAHFQIPQVLIELGVNAIDYIGTTDRRSRFMIITSLSELELKKYRKRGKDKPYVWIDFAPNNDGMLDCFVFNAPFIKQVSVVGVFKDLRQLEQFKCCTDISNETIGPDSNWSFLDQLIKDKITADKIKYYRQLAAPIEPNTQVYTTGNA